MSWFVENYTIGRNDSIVLNIAKTSTVIAVGTMHDDIRIWLLTDEDNMSEYSERVYEQYKDFDTIPYIENKRYIGGVVFNQSLYHVFETIK